MCELTILATIFFQKKKMFPALEDDQASQIPRDTFVTYSADGSIKFWNLDENVSLLSPSPDPESMPREYGPVLPSKEISRVLYVDETSKTWIQKPDIQGIKKIIMKGSSRKLVRASIV